MSYSNKSRYKHGVSMYPYPLQIDSERQTQLSFTSVLYEIQGIILTNISEEKQTKTYVC